MLRLWLYDEYVRSTVLYWNDNASEWLILYDFDDCVTFTAYNIALPGDGVLLAHARVRPSFQLFGIEDNQLEAHGTELYL